MNKIQNILIGITGGIAAYKCATLTRLFKKAGCDVKIMMTQHAKEFITPLTLATLSENPVYDDLFQAREKMATEHISLGEWADHILIAPATANCIAKLAKGIADDLLTTVCLGSNAPITIAPAMNVKMWESEKTQENLKHLLNRGIQMIEPANGFLACGDEAVGRMEEPDIIAETLLGRSQALAGKKVLITAGPTVEPIDPIRYLSNYSSGKMGFALAKAAQAAGADVTLITGPVNLSTPFDVKRINITTAKSMLTAVMEEIANADIFIASAAIADYRVKNYHNQKIKKDRETLTLELEKNPDILSTVAALKNCPFIVGFAAETEHLIDHAKQKLKNKKLDMIIANQIDETNPAFYSNENKVTVLTKHDITDLPKLSKKELAMQLVKIIAKKVERKNALD